MRRQPRKFTARFLLTLGMLISVAGGCSEPTGPTQGELVPPTSVKPPPIVDPPPPVTPRAYAGLDAWVPLPDNFSVLWGAASDGEYVESYSWKKVSGPDSYSIDCPDSQQTMVVDLEEGRYEFELTVTYRGSSGSIFTLKDRVSIVVYDPRTPGANEFIFKNLRDSCFARETACVSDTTSNRSCDNWWSDQIYFVIENFNDYVPAGTEIKVFLKVAGSANWVEVSTEGENYVYRINGNRFVLEIETDQLADPNAPVDIMIAI
jgi:hypothetical protein